MLKKMSVWFLLLVMLMGACSSSQVAIERGIQFAPETLGLTPGSSITEINLNWYSNAGNSNVALVRFID